jgi:4-amino-4-deoxy-L-arabinose transferase-like glycosyltransferase
VPNRRLKRRLVHVIGRLLLVWILALSFFVHLWNVSGFPSVHPDEGTYMRRTMHIVTGLGPQDNSSQFDHTQLTNSTYDHPYMGPLFLAFVLKAIGYPDVLHPTDDIHSIEMLYLIPRIIIGLLAVVDTFLLYKICERRYNRNVAIIASVLFAVMPSTWFLRRIVLDSILLPFLLSSVLFALYTKQATIKDHYKKSILLTLFSGIFLGLAIFTKAPAFTMIPMVAFLIYSISNFKANNASISNNNKRSWGRIGLWFIPVVLIPAIWPAYAIYQGQFDEWFEGVYWQGTERSQEQGLTIFNMINIFIRDDPLLLALGIAGLGLSAIKRDLFPLLWTIPYLIFIYLVGWGNHFHWISILPVLCIASALFLNHMYNKIIEIKMPVSRIMPIIIISAIVIFGFTSTTLVITTNISSSQYGASAFTVSKLRDDAQNNTTVISGPVFSWLFKYVYHKEHVLSHVRDSSVPINMYRTILIEDSTYRSIISGENENMTHIALLKDIQKNSYTAAKFRDDTIFYDFTEYPYSIIRDAQAGSRRSGIDININY